MGVRPGDSSRCARTSTATANTDFLKGVQAIDDADALDPFKQRYTLLSGSDGSEVWTTDDIDEVFAFPRDVLDMGGTAGPDRLLVGRGLTVTALCNAPTPDCVEGRVTLFVQVLCPDSRTGEVFSDTSRT